MNNSPGRSRVARKKRNVVLPALLVIMGCVVFLFAAWSAITSPVLASILNAPETPREALRPQPFAQVNIAKPSTATEASDAPHVVVAPTVTAALSAQPEIISILPADTLPTEIIPTLEAYVYTAPADTSIEAPTALPEIMNTPGMVYAEIIPDTPTPKYTAPTVAPYMPVAGNGGKHWIDVDLSQQRVYAYEGDTVVNSFIVSTGTWQTPTVTGKYKVWVKLRSAPMSGPGYYLPNVPYIMYFYGSYGLHGTYWHNNFGTPMSHGCVNLTIPDAEWLYNFSSVGTVVNVHY